MLTVLRQLWRGELPLAQAFWGVGVSGTLLMGVLLMSLVDDDAVPTLPVALALIALTSAWQTLISVGIWRSAGHYDGPRWLATVAQFIVIVYGLAGAFMLLSTLMMFRLLLGVLLEPPFIH